MSQPDTSPQTGTLSASLSNIARLLRSDPRVSASRAREILKRFPGQQQTLLLLVSARRLAGDISGARNILRAMAKAEPKLAAVQYELGLLLSETGDTEEAIAAFSRTVELEPLHSGAWRALGDQLSEAGKISAASTAYARHLEVCDARRCG
jgi:predicted Zn-dependent protease